MPCRCFIFSGGQATVDANFEQQQYELIACLERSFQELVASNFALCSRFNRLEQLVLHHRSAFAHQEAEQRTRSGSAVPGNTVTQCVGSGSHQQTHSGRFSASVGETMTKRQWTGEEWLNTRGVQAKNNVHETGLTLETEDVWASSAVSSQQGHRQNVADLSDIDAWPDVTSRRTAAHSQREYSSLSWVGLL